ncbi:hypothetical protein AB1L42_12850 [Thalassoglobus sp. JC818]|uniref:hypothetical protein n=1 Tax=Thalassoglobus sp. JC818 TaxID=3232136 RepID=UPI00345A6411
MEKLSLIDSYGIIIQLALGTRSNPKEMEDNCVADSYDEKRFYSDISPNCIVIP